MYSLNINRLDKKEKDKMRQFRWAVWGLIIAIMGFLAYAQLTPSQTIREDIRPFSLTNHHGEHVTHGDFAGKYMLIFFGYSFCPDVCPTELGKMSVALDLLEKEGRNIDNLQPIFITIDPARDTVAQMSDYVSLFHPKLIGLTGSEEEIAKVAKTYQVYYKKSDPNDTSDGYLMDHMSLTFLMDDSANRIHMFSSRETPEELAEALKSLTREK